MGDGEIIKEKPYWVALSAVEGIGPMRTRLLLEGFGSMFRVWGATWQELVEVGLPEKVICRLVEWREKVSPEKYYQEIVSRGIKVVTVQEKDYPRRLREISDPPPVLYLLGKISFSGFDEWLGERVIGVVGTRKMTAYGQEVTENLTRGLVGMGFGIVSGMAVGVDGVAHQAALKGGGRTVAVLGTGVEVVYPPEHRKLYEEIVREGAVVSEVAPERTVSKGVFPARNRIVSGLCQAILVTEGAIDSGSLITARAALDQGREVFAVPGPISSPMAAGTNYLLKQGAHLVTGVEDILTELESVH